MALVITRPDKRRGRGGATSPTPVAVAAGELGLAVSHDIAEVKGVGAELGVVVAYGRIVKPDVLAALPMVNIHFSLLPRWRGAAPVERALLAGDEETGVCLMDVEEGLDTGAVYRRQVVAIEDGETALALTDRLAVVGADLLVTALGEGLGPPQPQIGEATYAAKIEHEDRHLNWASPADHLARVVRVGRAWTVWNEHRLLVLEATPAEGPAGRPGTVEGDVVATGEGGLRLVTVQPEGRKAMPATAWLRGAGSAVRLG